MVIRKLLMMSLVLCIQAAEPITVGLEKSVLSLNPLLLSREVESQVVDMAFDRLVTLDDKGAYVPQMLSGWEISKDGRDILLTLRPGQVWQDGKPITAEDVVHTWHMLSLPEVRKVFDLEGVRTLDSVKAEGPLKVRIHLRQARATLLADLYNFQPVPRHLYGTGADRYSHPLNLAPVGSGPYRVLAGATSKEMHLELWPGYKGPHPGRWERFYFRVQSEEPAVYVRQLKSGDFHFAAMDWFHHYLLRKGVFGDGRLVPRTVPTASFDTFWLNCDPKSSLLSDQWLRVALAELLPWEFLMAQRSLRSNRPAYSLWPPQSWAFDASAQHLPKLERARELLDAAGWEMGPAGHRVNAKGRELRLVVYARQVFSTTDAVQAFCELAEKVGIAIELRRISVDEVTNMSAKGQGDIWCYPWNTSLDPNDDAPLFTTAGIASGVNVCHFRNAEVDHLFDLGRHELDPAARKNLYLQINTIVQREHPIIQLTYGVAYLGISPHLQGVAFNSLGQSYGFVPGRRGWALTP
jgi:peptide/nickel transport system substrate-binding protein